MAENLPHRAAAAAAPMAALDWEGDFPDRLRSYFPDALFKSYLDQHWVECTPGKVPALLEHLRDREQFDMLTDLTAVDRPEQPARFEVVYLLYSFANNERLRVKTRVSADSGVPTAVNVFAGANWLEREVFDMFGLQFSGHPNLKRILLPDDWSGHPLRKEKSIVEMDNDWVQRNLGIESGQ